MDKVAKAKLHSPIFCAGVNLSQELSSAPGAKQVDMEMQGNFLKVTLKGKSILIPFTNVQQIELETQTIPKAK